MSIHTLRKWQREVKIIKEIILYHTFQSATYIYIWRLKQVVQHVYDDGNSNLTRLNHKNNQFKV